MSERVNETKWVWQWPDGQLGAALHDKREDAERVMIPHFSGRAVRVALVEVDETQAASDHWKDRAIKAAIVETGDTYRAEWDTNPEKLVHDVMLWAQRVATDPSVNGGFKLTPASPPWPPTWGEGPREGWCRQKSDGSVWMWQWCNGTELLLLALEPGNGFHCTLAEFAAEFEPL